MDQLPVELLEMIFSCLNLKDRVNCRRVNKKWKFILDHLKIRSLMISGVYDPKLHYLRWIHKNQFISMQNYVEVSDLNKLLSFKRSANYLQIDNLKELAIHQFKYFLNDPNFKKFNQIEKLFIKNLDFDSWSANYDQELILNLPNLKELKVHSNYERITFILPKLKKLDLRFFTSPSSLSFIHPEPIEYAHFDGYYESLEKFVNLKVLICDSLLDSGQLKSDFLSNFRSINEIQTDDAILFNRLLIQKRQFELNDLNLYFRGLNTSRDVEIENYDNVLREKKFHRYLNNYSKMANQIYTIHKIIYNDTERVYSNIPDDLMKKFINLRAIEISGPLRDESQFVEFLKKTKTIECLDFEISSISKKLLKTISIIYPNLVRLFLVTLTETKVLTEKDLDVVFYFSNLTQLSIKAKTFDLSNLTKKLFLKLKNLKKLSFYCCATNFNAHKKEDNSYSLWFGNERRRDFKNLNDLISFCEENSKLLTDYFPVKSLHSFRYNKRFNVKTLKR